jgi:predicted lactoylglutathione lyase
MAMPQAIFVNLPVTDLPRSRRFYEALGFDINPMFSDEGTACVVISDTIYLMLATHARLKEFTKLPIGDPKKETQHLLSISCDSRAAVDAMAAAALGAGGAEVHGAEDLGFMYSRGFTDPDGHGWGPLWMDPAAAAGGPPDMDS